MTRKPFPQGAAWHLKDQGGTSVSGESVVPRSHVLTVDTAGVVGSGHLPPIDSGHLEQKGVNSSYFSVRL